MPAATMDLDDRPARVKEICALVERVGGQANAGRILAALPDRQADPKNTIRLVRRWMAATPAGEGRRDIAPDWAIDALKEAASRAGAWLLSTADDGRRIATNLNEPYVTVIARPRSTPVVLGAKNMSVAARDKLIRQAMKVMSA